MNEAELVGLNTHEEIERNSWDLLVKGANRSKEAFHLPVLGTMGLNGPELRTVVLRQAIREEKILLVHTDIRSGKIAEIRAQDQVSLLFYDKSKRIQLRLSARATIHEDDELAKERWAKSTLSSRRCYLAEKPGTIKQVASHGLPPHLYGEVPELEESEAGYVNFAVIKCQVQNMEWLWLHHKGHRRAAFQYDKDRQWSADWLTP